MSNQALQFKRVTSMPSSDITAGAVYFEDSTGLLHVGISSSTYKTYSGVKDVTWDSTNALLTFTNSTGTTVRLDFDNLVGYDDFDALVSGTGLIRQGTDTSIYRLGANGTGIADTNYISGIDSSTVSGALKTLDTQLKTVTDNSGVISLGGAKGVLSIDNSNTSTGEINFTIDGSTLKASIADTNSAAYKTVDFFVGNSTDASTNDTIKGAKKYTAEVLGTDTDTSTKATVYGVQAFAKDNLGKPGDTSAAITIYGARQKAADVKKELLGTVGDVSTVKTIEGLTTKINEVNTNTTLHLYSGTEGTTEATHVTADGSTYRLVQGTTTVATFNIEKDSFVQDGSVRNFTTDADASAATGDPSAKAGHYIHLIIKTSDASSGAPAESNLWIPAESLVDAYTADNDGKNVTININQSTNKISATVDATTGTKQLNLNGTDVTLASIAGINIIAKLDTLASVAADTVGGVQLSESNNELSASLIDNAVTTAKIVNDNVTTAKLDSSVRTSLGKANTAIQSVSGETAVSNSSYVAVSVEASTNDRAVTLTSHANVTVQNVSTSDANTKGLAEASDVKTYVQTYVGEQLTWAAWPS